MGPKIEISESGLGSSAIAEQLFKRSCVRCGGLLVNEWYYGVRNTDTHDAETLRCVQCGHRIDPVILQNQTRPPIERLRVRPERHKRAGKIVMLREAYPAGYEEYREEIEIVG